MTSHLHFFFFLHLVLRVRCLYHSSNWHKIVNCLRDNMSHNIFFFFWFTLDSNSGLLGEGRVYEHANSKTSQYQSQQAQCCDTHIFPSQSCCLLFLWGACIHMRVAVCVCSGILLLVALVVNPRASVWFFTSLIIPHYSIPHRSATWERKAQF